ncbi:MAG: hypothetical protein KGJ89_01750 [Patescibacteria group bacterium]|nr:hypothetical protein [Patescibacteria group bacterium]MDE2015601.1 hypothetical protein [Patescibacteria group bacterium]MDE2226658.1 hypothetical protein [Patescibacteria group bacterium]
MRNKRNKNSGWVIFILVMVTFGMLGLGGVFSAIIPTQPAQNQTPDNQQNSNASSSRELALSCTSDTLTQFHIHPTLTIIANGVKQTIPANIGITADCLRVIHTHDDTGVIHVESPQAENFTLGDFFAVWGKVFNQGQVLDYKADAGHEIVMTVDGKPSTEYENLILKDGQKIVVEYKNRQ